MAAMSSQLFSDLCAHSIQLSAFFADLPAIGPEAGVFNILSCMSPDPVFLPSILLTSLSTIAISTAMNLVSNVLW
jgi:hypothetical protein